VSVALCTFNGARYLPEQLRSLTEQTSRPHEIVVVDDGSTDATVAVLQAFQPACDADMTVRLNDATLGTARNFERALSLCSGDILFLADQDDVWPPQKVDRMVAEFERRPGCLLVHSNARLVDAGLVDLGQSLFDRLRLLPAERELFDAGEYFRLQLRRNVVTGCTVAIRRELLDLARPFPEHWLHDEWLAVIAAAVGDIRRIDEPLVLYRQHAGNQLGIQRTSPWQDVRRVLAGHGELRQAMPLRLGALVTAMRRLGPRVPAWKLDLAERTLAHARFRAGLPGPRWRRLAPVLAEAARGGYRRYSRGLKSVVTDLLEPF
jgi:hypothetical protein